MNLAQRIAAAATLLAVAVFLFLGGHQGVALPGRWDEQRWSTDWARTGTDIVGILIVGGVGIWLFGTKRTGRKPPDVP